MSRNISVVRATGYGFNDRGSNPSRIKIFLFSKDSSVGIAAGSMGQLQFLAVEDFLSPHNAQTVCCYPMSTGNTPAGRREASTPSSAEFNSVGAIRLLTLISSWHSAQLFLTLPDVLRSSGSETDSIQLREYNWGATWKK
jgi:hypothetical protein